jgi:hypothetical protein
VVRGMGDGWASETFPGVVFRLSSRTTPLVGLFDVRCVWVLLGLKCRRLQDRENREGHSVDTCN